MWLDKCGKWTNEFYKIQIVNIITNEEFWIRFYGSIEKGCEFFKKMAGYQLRAMRWWEIEGRGK